MRTIKGHYVDVIAERIFDAEITIDNSVIRNIKAIDKLPEDAPYVMPGFIDSHMHIESTQLLPENLAKLAVTQGAVGIVNDPHEIANVLGVPGIEFMIDNSKRVRFHYKFGIPSCVPSTCFETAGASVTATDVKALLDRDEFYGLAEMMNYPGVLYGDPEVLAKIRYTLKRGKLIDGHAPGLNSSDTRKYFEAGITTDHEMYDIDQARERLELGMKVLIREGSAGCNFQALYPLLMEDKYKGMLMFCTDDIYVTEFKRGHINSHVARAIALGVPFWNAIHAACVAPVRHYRLDIGLLQPGDNADLVLVDNIKDFNVIETIIDGVSVFSDGKTSDAILTPKASEPVVIPNKFCAKPLRIKDIRIKQRSQKIKVIMAINKELLTGVQVVEPKLDENGYLISDVERDILKIVVYNRYNEAVPAVAFIHGFGIKSGAFAASVAHDSHNIIAVGTTDEEIVEAINTIIENKGGMVTIGNGKNICVPLPVAGLMSDKLADELETPFLEMKKLIIELGSTMRAPLMTMSFMALPVIPELKLSDKGLFDVKTFNFTNLFVEN